MKRKCFIPPSVRKRRDQSHSNAESHRETTSNHPMASDSNKNELKNLSQTQVEKGDALVSDFMQQCVQCDTSVNRQDSLSLQTCQNSSQSIQENKINELESHIQSGNHSHSDRAPLNTLKESMKKSKNHIPFSNNLDIYSLNDLQEEYQKVIAPEKALSIQSELSDITLLQRLNPESVYDRLMIKEWSSSKDINEIQYWIQSVVRNGVSGGHKDFTGETRELEVFGSLARIEKNITSQSMKSMNMCNTQDITTSEESSKSANNLQLGTSSTMATCPNPSDISSAPFIYVASDMRIPHETLTLVFASCATIAKHLDSLLGHTISLKSIQIVASFKYARGKYVVNSSHILKHENKLRKNQVKNGVHCLGLLVDSEMSVEDRGIHLDYTTCKHLFNFDHDLNLLKRKCNEFGLDKRKSQKKSAKPTESILCGIPLNKLEYSSNLCAVHHTELVEGYKASRLELASSSQSTFECKPLPEVYIPCVYYYTNKYGVVTALNFDFSSYRSKEYCELRAPLQDKDLSKKKIIKTVNHMEKMRNFINNSQNASASVLQLQMVQESKRKLEKVLSSTTKSLDSYETALSINRLISFMDSNPVLGKDLKSNSVLEFDLVEDEDSRYDASASSNEKNCEQQAQEEFEIASENAIMNPSPNTASTLRSNPPDTSRKSKRRRL